MFSFAPLMRGALILTIGFAPTVAVAQDVAGAFAELQGRVKPHEHVVVTDESRREIKGEISGVSSASLTLDTNRDRRVFAEHEVRTIARRDSVVNGMLIGLGAGAVTAWAFTRKLCGPAGYDPECSAIAGAVGTVIFLPSGAVAGALIDRFIPNATIFRSVSGTSKVAIGVSPLLSRTTRGGAISIAF